MANGSLLVEPKLTLLDIHFVLSREPNPNWGFDVLTPPKHCCTMILNRGGTAHYDFDGYREHFVVKKGDVVFAVDGDVYHPHADRDDPWAFTTIQFHFDPDDAVLEQLKALPKVLHHQNNPQIPRLFGEIQREWSNRPYGWSIRCKGMLYEIMCENFRHGMANDCVPHAAKLRALMAAMDDDPAHPFTTEEMSAMTGLSADALRRNFRQLTGTSPVQYLNRLRINRARELLMRADCNVSEAAWRVGFSDIYYFSRLFKKIDGHSPSYYISIQSL